MQKDGNITLRDIYLEIKEVGKMVDGHNKRIVKLEKKSNLLNYSVYIVAASVFVNVFIYTQGDIKTRWSTALRASSEKVQVDKK